MGVGFGLRLGHSTRSPRGGFCDDSRPAEGRAVRTGRRAMFFQEEGLRESWFSSSFPTEGRPKLRRQELHKIPLASPSVNCQ
jgi:hypothetical protein